MDIRCINHEAYRELTQLSWAIFGNTNGEILSQHIDGEIHTTILFEGKTYKDCQPFREKNDAKRSLYKAAMQIRKWDVPWGILTGINPAKLAFNHYDKQQFMDRYFVSSRQADLSQQVAEYTKSIKVEKNDISLYIGIPFCKTKCKYCSFVSNSIDKANKSMTPYVDCLIAEIEATAPKIANRPLKSIYIGGGTPTALDDSNLERLLLAIKQNFNTEVEYTVEAGRVDTITEEKLHIIKSMGGNRISINPQVFDDDILQSMGRNHTAKEVEDIYYKARNIGFDAINMDIIYGLGGKFEHTVDKLLELSPENITIHTLAIKKGSMLSKEYLQNCGDIHYFYDKIYQEYKPYYMYRQQYMVKPYENVGFYKDDKACLYNVYMMENMMDILALGSGSTSKINGESYFNNKYPVDYINSINKILDHKKQILE